MNRTNNPMQDEKLDRLIEAHFCNPEADLEPSSGFATSVVQAVASESAAPEPIRFPWRRVIPGMAIVLLGLIALCVLAVLTSRAGTNSAADPILVRISNPATGIFSVAVLSLAIVSLTARWALRRG